MTEDELGQIVMTTQECGMGDRDAAGKFRKMFCDDESLSRYDGKSDKCACRTTVKAIIERLACSGSSSG